MADIDPSDLSLKSSFTTDICIALRRPDGFKLPHNLVRETILWEMSALFDYCSLLSLCVSCPLPPVSSSYTEHIRLKDEGKESEYLDSSNMVCSFMYVIMQIYKSKVHCFMIYCHGNTYVCAEWAWFVITMYLYMFLL